MSMSIDIYVKESYVDPGEGEIVIDADIDGWERSVVVPLVDVFGHGGEPAQGVAYTYVPTGNADRVTFTWLGGDVYEFDIELALPGFPEVVSSQPEVLLKYKLQRVVHLSELQEFVGTDYPEEEG